MLRMSLSSQGRVEVMRKASRGQNRAKEIEVIRRSSRGQAEIASRSWGGQIEVIARTSICKRQLLRDQRKEEEQEERTQRHTKSRRPQNTPDKDIPLPGIFTPSPKFKIPFLSNSPPLLSSPFFRHQRRDVRINIHNKVAYDSDNPESGERRRISCLHMAGNVSEDLSAAEEFFH